MEILYFAPIRLYPDGHGNIATVHQYIKRLKYLGHKVHYVYFDEQNLSKENIFLMQKFVDTLDVIKRIRNPNFKRDTKGYWKFDTRYQEGLGEKIRDLCLLYNIDVVICTYIMQSKILEYVPDRILKIIDTHDRMADRHLALKANNIKDEFFSCTKEDEAKYLSRADIVWARRDEETCFFNEIMNDKKAITVSHFDNPNFRNIKKIKLKKIGFLASRNNVNAKMVMDFSEAYLEYSKSSKNKIEIIIAGEVRDFLLKEKEFMQKIENSPIKLVGRVENVKDFYEQVDAVIVPITFGTGINVKMIEAMSFGLPVISTTCGIKGCGETSSKYHKAKDLFELVKLIDNLYENQNDLADLAKLSKQIFNKFYEKNSYNFDNCFTRKRVEQKQKSLLCSGCGICAGICTSDAIEMKINKNGFYRACKQSGCIDCGVCDKICSIKNKASAQDAVFSDAVFGNYNNVYAIYSNDLKIRTNSSTAGFIRNFLACNLKSFDGVVVLCESEDALKPEIELLKSVSDVLEKTAKSKYFSVEVSEMAKILRKNSGHFLVVGLPCQIASLKNAQKFLKGTFFFIELFCGAIYSLNFMKNYLNFKGYDSVSRLDFRDKISGWHNFSLTIFNKDKKISTKANEDEFYFAQRNKFFTQESCLKCSYCYAGVGDIQVGDFWGKKYQNNDSGVNLVITRSKKADELLLKCGDFQLIKCSIRDVYQSQPWFVEYYRRNILKSPNLKQGDSLDEKITLNQLAYLGIDDVKNIKENYKNIFDTFSINKVKRLKLFKKSFLIITPDSSLGSFGDQAMMLTLISKIKEKYSDSDIALFNVYQDNEDGVLLNEGFDIVNYYPNGNVIKSFSDIIEGYTDILIVGADILDGGCGKENSFLYFELIKMAHKKGKMFRYKVSLLIRRKIMRLLMK